MRRTATALALAAVFLAMVGAASPPDLVLALAIGGIVARFAATDEGAEASGGVRLVARVAAIPWLALGIALELARGGLATARFVLRPRNARLGAVELPYGERSPRGAAFGALVASATPGTVLLELDDERRVMRLTAIDATRPEETRRRLDAFYDRFQRHVLP